MNGRLAGVFFGLIALVVILGIVTFYITGGPPAQAPAQQQAQPQPMPVEPAPTPVVVDPEAVAETPAAPAPPVARIEPKVFEANGVTRTDNYYWMRDKANPEVIKHLEAENAYAASQLAPLAPLVDELYKEMADREDDAEKSVPYFDNGYWYETRFTEGADYPVVVRRKGTKDAAEEVVLDEPALAKDHAQFNLNNWEVSPDGALVAYAVDYSGDRMHTIVVRRIATGEQLDTAIVGATEAMAWAADNKTLFFVRNDPKTVRGYQAVRHVTGTPVGSDVVVYEEKDDTFELAVDLTKSRKFIVISSIHLQTTEQRIVPAATPAAAPKVVVPREKCVQYDLDHLGKNFYIRTNKNAPDFRIARVADTDLSPAKWKDVVPQKPGTYIGSFEVFDNFIVTDDEHDAILSMRIFSLSKPGEEAVPMPTPVGIASMADFPDAVNLDPALTTIRFGFSSPTTPDRIYDYDTKTKTSTLLKEDPAVRWFKPELYEAARISATATDGESIPVTVLFRKDKRVQGGNPTLLYAYGSYGISTSPRFYSTWISLIDRGFVFAIAHVRGGREMGERWYDEGRMSAKKNTFTDYIAVGEALVAQGYASPRQLFGRGGSAGGLLMGAVANMKPELFAGLVAEVPFVDVITTMSDPTIPLTTFEYEEWGNPAIKDQFDYMLSYSPYDQVTAKKYPPLFVRAGLNDSQVGYFEPAKWVAKLRAVKTDDNPILFLTEMDAGHSGDSGRLGYLEDRAKVAAWLIDRAKHAETIH